MLLVLVSIFCFPPWPRKLLTFSHLCVCVCVLRTGNLYKHLEVSHLRKPNRLVTEVIFELRMPDSNFSPCLCPNTELLIFLGPVEEPIKLTMLRTIQGHSRVWSETQEGSHYCTRDPQDMVKNVNLMVITVESKLCNLHAKEVIWSRYYCHHLDFFLNTPCVLEWHTFFKKAYLNILTGNWNMLPHPSLSKLFFSDK